MQSLPFSINLIVNCIYSFSYIESEDFHSFTCTSRILNISINGRNRSKNEKLKKLIKEKKARYIFFLRKKRKTLSTKHVSFLSRIHPCVCTYFPSLLFTHAGICWNSIQTRFRLAYSWIPVYFHRVPFKLYPANIVQFLEKNPIRS